MHLLLLLTLLTAAASLAHASTTHDSSLSFNKRRIVALEEELHVLRQFHDAATQERGKGEKMPSENTVASLTSHIALLEDALTTALAIEAGDYEAHQERKAKLRADEAKAAREAFLTLRERIVSLQDL
ncbi:hypothetical protein RI367_005595 [Sorochytrium milnesiophthora]